MNEEDLNAYYQWQQALRRRAAPWVEEASRVWLESNPSLIPSPKEETVNEEDHQTWFVEPVDLDNDTFPAGTVLLTVETADDATTFALAKDTTWALGPSNGALRFMTADNVTHGFVPPNLASFHTYTVVADGPFHDASADEPTKSPFRD